MLHTSSPNKIIEYVYLFGVLAIIGYVVWLMFLPFISALALAAVIATICYPLYLHVLERTPWKNQSLAALITTLLVVLIIILPILFLASALFREALDIYTLLGRGDQSFTESFASVELLVREFIPGLELNITEYLRQAAQWLASHLGGIFAGTALTILSFLISMIGTFYFFRDGKRFTRWLIQISPLPDTDDELILTRLGTAVRAVATGTILVALIQGVLTALGFTIFGFERAILFGTIAAFGALVPGIGTTIVFVPAVAFLIFTGQYIEAIGLTVWGMLAVGLIDNFLGPYLMSRGNVIHPFLILLSVLGGVALMGPVGFIVGPVLISFFIVLLQLYSQHFPVEESIEN
ncbi:MAG: AI-2E family transporter [Candidatus Paceibacterota bacterium]